MDIIVEMRFGSHLYGTDGPESDLDLKAVFLPSAEDILLQRVAETVTESRSKAPGERNRPGDVDREAYSLQRFLALLAAGQTVALDMLFAPDAALTRPPAPLWQEIRGAAPRLVSRRALGFLSYCRQQADKFGLRGSRLATARRALSMLAEAEERLGGAAPLGELGPALDALAALPHAALRDIATPDGRQIRHLEVCGRKMPFPASIKSARGVAQRLVDGYGARALQAERDAGVDWKALSHAVRIGREALELLDTGRIVFPLRDAAHLRAIKQGRLPYPAVAAEIEALLEAVEAAALRSALPDAPDLDLIDALVLRAHRAQVLGAAP